MTRNKKVPVVCQVFFYCKKQGVISENVRIERGIKKIKNIFFNVQGYCTLEI